MKKIIYCSIYLLCSYWIGCPIILGQTIPNKTTVKLDQSIIYGQLNNGFTYYIKPIEKEHCPIKMSLIVKTGILYEKPSQADFSHAIEHLAFRETKNFPKGIKGDSSTLSSLGMSLRDVSAMTSGVKTVYNYLPSNKKESIEKGILWFSDILFGLDFSEERINTERGVLLQEKLSKQDSNRIPQRTLNNKLFPWISDRANFLEINKTFSKKDVQAYYYKWYKPERTAVCIAGNIDDAEYLIDLIKKNFSGEIKNFSKEGVEEPWQKYLQSDRKFEIIESDSMLNQNLAKPITVNLYYRDATNNLLAGTIEGMKRDLKVQLLMHVLNDRFKEARKSFNNPTNIYSVHTSISGNQHLNKPPFAFKVILKSALHSEKKSLETCILMMNQLKKHGLNKSEFLKAKRELLTNFPAEISNPTDYWIRETQNHFIDNTPLPATKNNLIRSFLKDVSLEEVNLVISDLLSTAPNDIGIIIPKNYQTLLNSEIFTRNFIAQLSKETVPPYKEPKVISEVMTTKEIQTLDVEEPVSLKKGKLGTKVFTLKNGVKLILNPAREVSKTDDLLIRGYSSNGASCIPRKDYYSAIYAPSLILNSGIGKLNKFELEHFYQNSQSFQMGFHPYINYIESGIKTIVDKKEVEDFLQLFYLFATQPQINYSAFKAWQNQQLDFSSRSTSNVNDLIDLFHKKTDDISAIPVGEMRTESLKKVEFSKAVDFHKQFFGDPAAFTFIITGDFEEKKLLPIFLKYLGNLKNNATIKCAGISKNISLSENVNDELISSKTSNPAKSFYGLGFITQRNKTDDWKEEFKVMVLGKLADRLLTKFRYEKGLSLYYFSAGGNFNRALDRYEIEFRLNCTSRELLEVERETNKLVRDLKEGKFNEDLLQIILKEMAIKYETMKQMQWENQSLYRHYKFGEPIIKGSEIADFLKTLTSKEIQKTAKEYFIDSNKFELKGN